MATTKLSQSLSALPDPPKENLSSHFILGEIIDQIGAIQDEFPRVRIPLLRSHLWDIRNKSVNPESHLRGFLQVFEHTDAYKELFEQLDDSMKKQIETFIAGGREGVVLEAGGKERDAFHLPPSLPVRTHLCDLKDVWDRLLHGERKSDADGQITETTDDKIKDESPRIFEDTTRTRIMEVSQKRYLS